MANAIDGKHQHAKSGKLYTYNASYDVSRGDIRWRATMLRSDDVRFERAGNITANTPAAETIAEQAVRDAVVSAIDALEDDPGL